MQNLALRNASRADLPAITAIYAHAVREGTSSYELEPPTRDEMAARYDALAASGYPYIVAEEGGTVVGYAYASAFRPRPAYRFIVENSVYVSPHLQGRGIGRLLLVELIARTTALGFRQMVAVIGDARPDSASVKLHEALGFAHSGRLAGSGYKHGRWLDTAFMQLEMNGGTSTEPDPRSLPERRFRAGT